MESSISWHLEYTYPKGKCRMRSERELKRNFRRHCAQWNEGAQAEIFRESKSPIESGVVVKDLSDFTLAKRKGDLIKATQTGRLFKKRNIAVLSQENETLRKLLLQRPLGHAWILYYQGKLLDLADNKEPNSVMNPKTTTGLIALSDNDRARIRDAIQA